jgi:benzoate 4-monooxygenase
LVRLRACLGRNIAEMVSVLFTACVFWRWDIVLAQGVNEWVVREEFLRKPMGLRVGIRRRDRKV